jgi:hypothetical protein
MIWGVSLRLYGTKCSRLGSRVTMETVSNIEEIVSYTVGYVCDEEELFRSHIKPVDSQGSLHHGIHPLPERSSISSFLTLRQMKMKSPAKCGTHFIVGTQRQHLTRLPGIARSSSSQRSEWKWSDWDDSVDPSSTFAPCALFKYLWSPY